MATVSSISRRPGRLGATSIAVCATEYHRVFVFSRVIQLILVSMMAMMVVGVAMLWAMVKTMIMTVMSVVKGMIADMTILLHVNLVVVQILSIVPELAIYWQTCGWRIRRERYGVRR